MPGGRRRKRMPRFSANLSMLFGEHEFLDRFDAAARAADRREQAGIKLLIDPINTRDIPGFFLNHTDHALALIDRVGSKNLFLQYDIYHMQIMEGDLARTIEANLGRIAHIQLADNPGRHEPGTGEINYPFLYDHIDRIGYSGWIGAEYKPKAGTEAGLGWFRELSGKGSAAA